MFTHTYALYIFVTAISYDSGVRRIPTAECRRKIGRDSVDNDPDGPFPTYFLCGTVAGWRCANHVSTD